MRIGFQETHDLPTHGGGESVAQLQDWRFMLASIKFDLTHAGKIGKPAPPTKKKKSPAPPGAHFCSVFWNVDQGGDPWEEHDLFPQKTQSRKFHTTLRDFQGSTTGNDTISKLGTGGGGFATEFFSLRHLEGSICKASIGKNRRVREHAAGLEEGQRVRKSEGSPSAAEAEPQGTCRDSC